MTPAVQTVRLSLPHRAIGYPAGCGECGDWARWSSPEGLLCPACFSETRSRYTDRRQKLAGAYGVSLLTVEECLVDEDGLCRISSPSIAPRLRYQPCWLAAAQQAAQQGRRHLGLQCRTVGRLVWGAGLHLGLDMTCHPRGAAYHPKEIDRDVVRWAIEEQGHLLWLRCYGRALLQHSPGRHHASLAASLDWMRVELALLRQQAPSLLPCSGAPRTWPPVPTHPLALLLADRPAAQDRSAA